ncbi:MAG: M48 family metallopeptidase [Clostridia bacterium]|nr:M48 family metallopeptidase [Clostridia bacterium]
MKDQKPEYKIIRSNRKTIGLSMTSEGLIVRAPNRASVRSIEKMVRENEAWIAKAALRQQRVNLAVAEQGPLTPEDIADLTARAKAVFPERVAHYAPLVGVTPGRITIRCQKSKWGSCSRKGNLNFNCLLLLAPDEVLDAIVVHELCHIKIMNHSRDFYDEVLRVHPDYRQCRKWIKTNGEVLMNRAAACRK